MLSFPGKKEIIIFMAYAQENATDAQKIQLALTILSRLPKVSYYDINISAGIEWQREEQSRLHTADIILLLVSWHFLTSDYCISKQLAQAIQRHNERKARVIPVILDACPWRDSQLYALTPLPKNGKPMKQWKSWDQALADIYAGIKKVIDELQNPSLPQGNSDIV